MEQQNLGIEDGSNDKRYFTVIPNYILNHSTLWDREVYIQMKRIAGENGTCWTSRNTLAEQCGMSPRRLDKSIKYLVAHKWIKIIGSRNINTKGGVQQVNEYRIADLWKINTEFYQDKGIAPNAPPKTKGMHQVLGGYSTDDAKGIAPGATKEEPLEEDHYKEEPPTTQGVVVNEIINLFKSVNPSYQRLFGKPPQRRAVERLLKQMGQEELTKAIGVLPKTNKSKYAPTITTPLQLEEKIGSLIAFIQKEDSQNKIATL